jgi:hypothetical protein
MIINESRRQAAGSVVKVIENRGATMSRPRNDVYTVLLLISLAAMVVSCALLGLDYSSYPSSKAPAAPTAAR